MKKTTFWVLAGVGILVFCFVVVQLFSVVIYSPVQEVRTEDSIGGIGSPEFSPSDIPTEGMDRDDALYNNTDGSKVQKTGSVSILVKNLDSAVESLDIVNVKYSGQVTNIYDYGRGNDRIVQLTIKVPVENFEQYYEEIRALDGEVTYANLGTNDLTEQYIDITSRLENLRVVETQLVEILKGANTVTDILAVQKELNAVRGDIESYEAQKRYFDSQTDYSYISLTFSIDKEGLNISDEPWKPLGEFRAALSALVSVLKGFVNMTIWILVFSPVVLVPVAIILYVTKRKQVK